MTGNRIIGLWAEPVVMGTGPGDRPVFVPGVIWLRWESVADGMVRIFINGQFSASSDLPQQRELMAAWDSSKTAIIEAVIEGENPLDLNRAGLLAEIGWLKKDTMPLDTLVQIVNDDTDEVVYEGPLWNGVWEQWGFGCGGFGEEGFSYDGGNAPGMAGGAFGLGRFGFDWIRRCVIQPAGSGLSRYQVRYEDGEHQLVEEQPVACYGDPVSKSYRLEWRRYDVDNDCVYLTIEF